MIDPSSIFIWRIGKSDYPPFSLPPVSLQGRGRFDSSTGPERYRVLYCGPSPNSVIAESLQRYRVSLRGIKESVDATPLSVVERDEMRDALMAPSGYVPTSFLEDYKLCSVSVRLDAPIADISSTRMIERIRYDLAQELLDNGLEDFDLSAITSLDRRLTQLVSRSLWEQGYAGISYISRFGADIVCYALFEDRYQLTSSAECIPVGKFDGLLDVADTLRLHLPR